MNQRDLWIPEYHVQKIETIGADWPMVLVEKWEKNAIGERRFIEVRNYVMRDPAPKWTGNPPDHGTW